MPAAKRRAAAKVDLHARGARVVSVFGPFASRVLIEMPVSAAVEMFPDGALAAAGPSYVIDAVERDVAAIRERDPQLADSTLAASALAMAYEIANPYNSATSKSMCDKAMRDAMKTLRDLLPPERKKDGVDVLAQRRDARRAKLAARGAAAKDLPRP